MTTSQAQDPTHAALSGCGARLRAAREAAGLRIEDVAARLHMPVRVVRWLEEEDWDRLGAPVFVRGQVRSYARLLGLGTTTMMEALDVAPVEPTRLVSRTHIPKLQWWTEQIGRRLVYIVLTLSLAVPAWVATRHHFAAAPAVAALDGRPTVPSKPHDQIQDQAQDQTEPRTVVASLAPLPAPTVAHPSASESSSAADILLRTHGKTWLKVTDRSGATLEQALLSAGEQRRFSTAQVGQLIIGDAQAVQLEVGGQPVDVSAHARANVARFAVSSDGSLVAAD
ncbi:helix-turn-helix domain-containing protein [Thermomonas hydrothermalis]|uniref:Cytoskeleton protein RodZ n=1 Tax=Thermomonas hydrothermalis TaxID=213588 RepID=A0A1M4XBX3_9GAMM|nr:RodZ domain-containing protein [Thermomonas hydrothermalis]SHE90875.1 cytoskeleton protein RodZ [Thermomonas hydrothermalis]